MVAMKLSDLFGWGKKQEQERQEIKRLTAEVYALPLEGARIRADAILRDATKYQLSPLESPLPEWLQGTARELLTTYGNISGLTTHIEIDLRHMGESEYMPGIHRIGLDIEEVEIVLVPNSDAICCVDPEVPEEALSAGEFCPSIYHYIVEDDVMANRA